MCEHLGEKEFLQLYGEDDFEVEGQDEESEELALLATARLEVLYVQVGCSSLAEPALEGMVACSDRGSANVGRG